MKLTRYFLLLCLSFFSQIQSNVPANEQEFSEAARLELEKHKLTLEADIQREKINCEANERIEAIEHCFKNRLGWSSIIGAIGLSSAVIIRLIRK